MSFLISVAVIVVYLMFVHQRVLDHFRLTARDNNLMWIGLLIPSILTNIFSFVAGAIGGTFLPISLIFMLLGSYLVYINYRDL